MPDLSHYFGEDLSVNSSGDLLTADSITLSQQRILRRLLTNLGDYIWNPTYGAGLPSKIGQPMDVVTVKSIVQAQMFAEATVVRNPPPVIDVTPIANGMFVEIQYQETDSSETSVLKFNVTN